MKNKKMNIQDLKNNTNIVPANDLLRIKGGIGEPPPFGAHGKSEPPPFG